MYAYDPTPLNAVTESADTTDSWVREKISFDAAYGSERELVYLYLPRYQDPPFDPVLYFPGAPALNYRSIDQSREWLFDFIVKTGRAVVLPVFKGTFERDDAAFSLTWWEAYQPETVFYRNLLIDWAKDLRRAIDYIATRSDINTEKVGYYGFSWGGMLAPIVLALEPRVSAAVLYVAGLYMDDLMPEADPFNYLSRVSIPVLMLGGKYDHTFDLETEQEPFFELLATPSEHKRFYVYETGHWVPAHELMRETLAWFDRYLGPVNK